jgi:hypothetical protein
MSDSLDATLTLFGVDHPQAVPESTLTFSVRLPVGLAVRVVALAENAHVSRNVMCRHLLDIGVEALTASLPANRLKEVQDAFIPTLEALSPQSTDEDGEE